MEEQQVSQASKPASGLISVGDLLKKSFDIYLKLWKTLVALIASAYGAIIGLFLILAVIALVFGLVGLPATPKGQFSFASYTSGLVVLLLFLIVLAATILLSLWMQVSMMCVVKERNNPIGLKQALKLGWKKIPSYVWVCFLAELAIIGGFMLFIVPGIIFAVWFSMSIYVFMSEDKRGTKALSESKRLVSGNWWAVLGRFLVLGLIAMVISWIPFFGSFANLVFTTPFFVIYFYLMYEDLKRLKG